MEFSSQTQRKPTAPFYQYFRRTDIKIPFYFGKSFLKILLYRMSGIKKKIYCHIISCIHNLGNIHKDVTIYRYNTFIY